MFTFETSNAEDVWKTILKSIMEQCEELEDEHDIVTKEFLYQI